MTLSDKLLLSNSAESGKDDLHLRFMQVRRDIFSRLVTRDKKKYQSFLRFLRMYKYVSLSLTRGHLLESYYLVMRSIDDVVDADALLPKPFEDPVQYVQGKIRFTNSFTDPQDPIESVYLYSLQLAKRLKISFQEETEEILQALLFDAQRRGKAKVFTRAQLSDHYMMLDIRGTIRAALKIFRERPDNYAFLEPLGRASRIFYDLQDFESDTKAGIVNIPKEDLASFGIDFCSMNLDDRAIRTWFVHQARHALKLIDEHRMNLKEAHFTVLTNAILKCVYEVPAKSFFERILHASDHA